MTKQTDVDEQKNVSQESKVKGEGDQKQAKELSDEDKQILEQVNVILERLSEHNQNLYKPALESLRTLIRSSTTSMTSVPKPLKFLRPHFDKMQDIYNKILDPETKAFCADIISVMGMTMSGRRDCLNFRLKGSHEDIGSWGHEYVRHLGAEIKQEWEETVETDNAKKEKLFSLVTEIVPYHMSHNAEAEACDLLMELERIDLIPSYVDKNTYGRVCLYIISCVPYVPDPENTQLLRCAVEIYRKFNKYPEALRCAMQLNDMPLIKDIFASCHNDKLLQKQLGYILARQQILFDPEEEEGADDEDLDLSEILCNLHLNSNFLTLARELDIMEPKVPEDVYKSNMEKKSSSSSAADSASQNLASTFVNAFLNAGFGKDKIVTEDGNAWFYKHKDHGQLSAAASLGLILLWDLDGGLPMIDRYLYSKEDNIKAGALLATGIVSAGIRSDCDPAKALLSDYVLKKTNILRTGAVIGLGLAYAGSNRDDIIELITPVLTDPDSNMEIIGFTALSLGMIAIGSSNGDVTDALLQIILDKSEKELSNTYARYIALGLALVFLGRQEDAEVILASLSAASEPIKSMGILLVDVCAYAGTGNVVKVQRLLHICAEHYEEKKEEEKKKKEAEEKKKKEEAEKKKKAQEAAKKAAKKRADGAKATTPSAFTTVTSDSTSEGDTTASTVTGVEKMDTDEGVPTTKEETVEMKAAEGETENSAVVSATDVEMSARSKEEEEKKKKEEERDAFAAHQGIAVIGVALLAMGEEIGNEMAVRTMGQLLRYGEPVIRRAVPLALALLNMSNPKLSVIDTLSKFSHDNDLQVACNATLAMGLCAAGTNNARLAAMLRQLAIYHKTRVSQTDSPQRLFMVRLAQGLTHMGKGTMTLCPYHMDRTLLSPVALGGILAVLISCLDVTTLILGKSSYVLYYIVSAIQPRMLVTLDSDLKPLCVPVRVGLAVDTVGQAGRPKTITGFQTHNTPVLLQYGERAELATEEYKPLSSLLEGFVILKKVSIDGGDKEDEVDENKEEKKEAIDVGGKGSTIEH